MLSSASVMVVFVGVFLLEFVAICGLPLMSELWAFTIRLYPNIFLVPNILDVFSSLLDLGWIHAGYLDLSCHTFASSLAPRSICHASSSTILDCIHRL